MQQSSSPKGPIASLCAMIQCEAGTSASDAAALAIYS